MGTSHAPTAGVAVLKRFSCLENACVGDRTLVGAAKLNQISWIVSFMLQESGGGGRRGRSFFKSSDSTPSSYIKENTNNFLFRDVKCDFFPDEESEREMFCHLLEVTQLCSGGMNEA